MPLSLKAVLRNYYTHNTNYTPDPRRLQSIIKVIESSRDNLNKPQVAHIVIQVESADFDKSSINTALAIEYRLPFKCSKASPPMPYMLSLRE